MLRYIWTGVRVLAVLAVVIVVFGCSNDEVSPGLSNDDIVSADDLDDNLAHGDCYKWGDPYQGVTVEVYTDGDFLLGTDVSDQDGAWGPIRRMPFQSYLKLVATPPESQYEQKTHSFYFNKGGYLWVFNW